MVNATEPTLRQERVEQVRALARTHTDVFMQFYRRVKPFACQRRWAKRIDNDQMLFQADFEPRDHGKTEIFVVSYPLRRICDNSDIRILLISKTKAEAVKSIGVVKTELENNDLLHHDFGNLSNTGTRLEGQSAWRENIIYCKRKRAGRDPTMEAVGIGGQITGGHYDIIILDDVEDDENTRTSERMQRIIEWFQGTVLQLREPWTKIIVVGTFKTAGGDLYEYIRDNELFNVNIEMAIPDVPLDEITYDMVRDDAGIPIDVDNINPPEDKIKVLCPEKWPIRALIMDLLVTSPVMFRREKQNDLKAFLEQVFHKDWFRFYDTAPELRWKVMTIDTAQEEKTKADFSVLALWGLGRTGFYLLDLFHRRVEFPELKAAVKSMYALHMPNTILIEDLGAGKSLRQEFQRDTNLPIVPMNVDRSKEARARSITPLAQAGRIYIPRNVPWAIDWLNEHVMFPEGKHDDQVDTTVMAINFLKNIAVFEPVEGEETLSRLTLAGSRQRVQHAAFSSIGSRGRTSRLGGLPGSVRRGGSSAIRPPWVLPHEREQEA